MTIVGKTDVRTPLPKYRSHKEVGALKIAKMELAYGNRSVEPNEETDGGVIITPAEDGFAPFKIGAEAAVPFRQAMSRDDHDTGYCVFYKDGYKSWSPTKAFEDGYTKI